jgi:hypothetical protein
MLGSRNRKPGWIEGVMTLFERLLSLLEFWSHVLPGRKAFRTKARFTKFLCRVSLLTSPDARMTFNPHAILEPVVKIDGERTPHHEGIRRDGVLEGAKAPAGRPHSLA